MKSVQAFFFCLFVMCNGCNVMHKNITDTCCQKISTKNVAIKRNISIETVELLHKTRGLTNEEICLMAQSKLNRAIKKATNPKPDHPQEAASFRHIQMQDEEGIIPDDGLVNASMHIRKMKNLVRPTRSLTRDSWEWIGPGNIGGRIRSIVIHPQEPNKMWVGSVAGGIWHTDNGGEYWQPVDDFMTNLAVSTMVIDPKNPDIIYAGTGEGFYNADRIKGAGIFMSSDGGVTWNQQESTTTDSWHYVNRLAVSPTTSSILLAANVSGIWRTNNRGASWEFVYDDVILDIDFHPTNHNYAVASGYGSIYYSSDSGLSWGSVKICSGGRIEVAYAPSEPDVVYASVFYKSGQIWKSSDRGKTFHLVSSGYNYLGNQGWYDNIIWVDPTDSNHLIVGGIDLWRSSDGGRNLRKISYWQYAPRSVHADHHMIVAHPDFDGNNIKTVFFGNDGGIYKTDNVYTAQRTTGWTELNNNLGITQFYGAAGNAESGIIIGGTQDNGTLRYSGDTESWSKMFGGDGGFCASDPNDPNYMYGEYVYLQIHRSTNGGRSSSYISPPIGDERVNFIAPFILNPNNSNTMLAGASRLWRSLNIKAYRPQWRAIKPAISSPISTISVSKSRSSIIWVGHNNGRIFKTTNGLSVKPSWQEINKDSSMLPRRYVMCITIDGEDSNVIYATYSGFRDDNVWRTDDGGESWTDITGVGDTGLPKAPVRSLVINPFNSDRIYVGTEVGVFFSENRGQEWTVPHSGPSNVSVDQLFWLNPNTLIAATHGRGMFKAEINNNDSSPAVNVTPKKISVRTENTKEITKELTIENTGQSDLKWNLSLKYETHSSNYKWTDSDKSSDLVFNWKDISKTGTSVTDLRDDNYSGPYPINGNFRFFGNVYTDFYISSNGFIGFGNTRNFNKYRNTNIPDNSYPNNILAWCWDDLSAKNGSVYYQAIDNKFVIQFLNYGRYGSDKKITAEVIFDNDSIIYQYKTIEKGFTLSSNTVGIENENGTNGVSASYNTQYLHDSLAIRFTRKTLDNWMSVAPVLGTIKPRASQNITLNIGAQDLEAGNYNCVLVIESNDPDNKEIHVPISIIVGR